MAWTEDQERAFRARKQLWRISTLGMELVASIVGMFLLGWLIDYWVGSDKPTYRLIGLAVGFIGGFWNFFKEVSRLRKTQIGGMDRKKPAKPPTRPPADSAKPPTAPAPAGSRKASPPVSVKPGPPRRRGRDPQLFAREHFTDEQLDRIEEEGEIRWPEGFEASPVDQLPPDTDHDDAPDDEDRPR